MPGETALDIGGVEVFERWARPPIPEPTYPAPLVSVAETRQQLRHHFMRLNAVQYSVHSPEGYACKNKEGDECPHYKECGYQAQKKKQGQVVVIPQQLVFQDRDWLPEFDLIIYDESFFRAALVYGKDAQIMPLDLLRDDRAVGERPRKNVSRET